MLRGAISIRRAVRKFGVDIVMPRSTLPAIATIIALRGFANVRLLFDADGLPHDERVDFAGQSAESIVYRLLRDFEAFAVRRADAILTRSRKAVDILIARGGAGTRIDKFHVVSNGRDTNVFRPGTQKERHEVRLSIGIGDTVPLIVYVGSSLGGKYYGRGIFEFFKVVQTKRPDARLLLLLSSPSDADIFLKEFSELHYCCDVRSVEPINVSKFLGVCDLGISLIHPKYSMQAVAAIKLGEYLLCGIPVLASSGIGDADEFINKGVGYLLPTMSQEELENAAEWFLKIVLVDREGYKKRAREVGLMNFSLESSVSVYEKVIKLLK